MTKNETGLLILYNGQYGVASDSNGLLHMRARYYNPEIMRFTSPGPWKDGLNWYAYANGSHVSYFDPFGLFAKCPSGINWGLGSRLLSTFGDSWREGIETMHTWGGGWSVFASYCEGAVGTAVDAIDYVTNPYQWVKSVNDFLEDPWRNNPIYAIGSFYSNIWNASMSGDWNSVAHSLGSATVTLPMAAYGMSKTPFGRIESEECRREV